MQISSQFPPINRQPARDHDKHFHDSFLSPRGFGFARPGVTEAIAAEIGRADANLENILDRLIVQFTAGHPVFTTAYATARKIVQTGSSHEPAPSPAPPVP